MTEINKLLKIINFINVNKTLHLTDFEE